VALALLSAQILMHFDDVPQKLRPLKPQISRYREAPYFA
jgi:hypothetical protein